MKLVPSSTSLLFGPERAQLYTGNGLRGLTGQNSHVPSVRVDLKDNDCKDLIRKAEVTISSDLFYFTDDIINDLSEKKKEVWLNYWKERGKDWNNKRTIAGASLYDVRIYLLYLFLVVC